MISCAIIERPGRWRWAGLALVFAIALTPVLPLVLVAGEGGGDWLGAGFGNSLLRSFAVAGAVALVSLAVGLPGGVLAGLYRIPLRRILLPLVLLPLLAPPFLWALGLSMLRIRLGFPADGLLSGFSGTVIAFVTSAHPLVFFTALLATRGLTRGQVDAARITGGEWRLIRSALRHAMPVTLLAALLAGVLTVSDPGAGQILGYEGASSRILVSFAATYDFPQAARQSLLLAGLILIASLPLVVFAAPRLSAGLLGRAPGAAPLAPHRSAGTLALAVVVGTLAVTFGSAFAGLSWPAFDRPELGRAWQEAAHTLPDTFFYAVVSGVLAAIAGCLLAFCAGSHARLRTVALIGLLVVLTLPPSLGALGLVTAASDAPPAWDGVLRSRFAVAVWLGARLFPVAALFALRRMASMSPTWASAAAVHGVPLRIYLFRVVMPWLWPTAAVSALLVGLLAIGDISSMLLLHPPGNGSLPLAIFTVMANAPESLVASLCLLYVMGFAIALAVVAMVTKPDPPRK